MSLHLVSTVAFGFQFFGYLLLSTMLLNKRREQDERFEGSSPLLVLFGFARKPERMHPKQPLYATINLLVSAFFAGCVAEATVRGKSNIFWSMGKTELHHATHRTDWTENVFFAFFHGWPLIKALVWQAFAEYYWHRLMHLPWFYRNFHKLHHFHKAPGPYDDLFIHPIEACGYFCILYSPAFLVGPMPLGSFLCYMTIMGILGVLDHRCADLEAVIGEDRHSKHEISYDADRTLVVRAT